jgi:tetratricopeptide (TPR) repeat protein
LADLLLLDRRVEEAKKHYEAAARGLPGAPDPRVKLGLLAQATGDSAKALALWQEVFRDRPESVTASNNLAWEMASRPAGSLNPAEVTLARSALGAAVTTAPKEPAVLDTAAWLHYQLGDDPEALRAILEATRRAPYRAISQFHLGMILARQGNRPEARRALSRALQLDPQGAFADPARHALARIRF